MGRALRARRGWRCRLGAGLAGLGRGLGGARGARGWGGYRDWGCTPVLAGLSLALHTEGPCRPVDHPWDRPHFSDRVQPFGPEGEFRRGLSSPTSVYALSLKRPAPITFLPSSWVPRSGPGLPPCPISPHALNFLPAASPGGGLTFNLTYTLS